MDPTNWIKLAQDSQVRQKIARDPVLPLYQSLLTQFSSWQPLTWDNSVVGLHIVFGWIPTMLRLDVQANLSKNDRSKIVQLLNDARIRFFDQSELQWLKTNFFNNQIVSLSKMLHFLAPDRYAIWDSRVIKNWYYPSSGKPRYTQPNEYMKYLHDLQSWRTDSAIRIELGKLKTISTYLNNASDMRLIELPLFHA